MTSSRGNNRSLVRCRSRCQYSNGNHDSKNTTTSTSTMTDNRVKKTVHFAKANRKNKNKGTGRGSYDVSIQVKYLPLIEEQDKKNLYFSSIDKKTMREDAFDIAREISTRDNETDALKHQPDRLSYTSLLTRAFQACCCKNDNTNKDNKSNSNRLSDEHECLIQYVAKSYAHTRGLEKHTIEYTIKENRTRLRKNSIRTYIDEYATIMANYGYLSSKSEASLTESYRRSSVPSQKFARLMGQVDQEAVALERQMEEQDQYQYFCKEERQLESPRTVLETAGSSSSSLSPVCSKQLFHQADENRAVVCQ